ncbi:MAG: hypothetical protein ACRDOC_09955 [Streptosporangiaceae bacterium]
MTRAVREVRPLLAGRGYATPAGPRLSTLADVFACAAAHGVRLRLDGSEIQVRRPPARRPGRRAFVSGEEEAAHRHVHQGLRRARAHPGRREVPARADAGPDRAADRRHR